MVAAATVSHAVFDLMHQHLIENPRLSVRRTGQLGNSNGIAPKHLCRDAGWIVARSENDDVAARDLLHKLLEIAIRRDQNKVSGCGVLEDAQIADTRESIAKRGLGTWEEVAEKIH